MAKLILVRHGQSEWNKLGKWTGYVDVGLTEQGVEEAKKAGESIRGFDIHKTFTSGLKRAQQTFDAIKETLGLAHDAVVHPALNERHYGIYTGKNKWDMQKEVGDEEFHRIRRSWNYPLPEGETLKDVYERAVPYYQESIFPEVASGKNVLLVAHGNSLRALVKHLEDISDEEIPKLEIATGEVYCYEFGEDGVVCGKTIFGSKNAH
ncbi:2,3-diphosphoglycerate-dependent phosphoglycerate mutase [Patescibacteria group bacterium]|nr:2,3-diphosphoglycerate-dependent phosphoglycerate mutase [Patescibacteria group bacterium]